MGLSRDGPGFLFCFSLLVGGRGTVTQMDFLDFEPLPEEPKSKSLFLRFQELGPASRAWFLVLGFWPFSFGHVAAGADSPGRWECGD